MKEVLISLSELIDKPNPSQPTFELSYGRTAINSFDGFPLELMDALSLRSKKSLLAPHTTNCLRTFTTGRLPSPSVFETLARFVRAEDYENAAKDVESLALRSLHVALAYDRTQDNQVSTFIANVQSRVCGSADPVQPRWV